MTQIGVPELIIFIVPITMVVLLAALVTVSLVRNRPRAHVFATAHQLVLDADGERAVMTALRRTRSGRVWGATIGGVLGAVLSILVVIEGTIKSGVLFYFAVAVGILIGTMVGIAVAQRRPREPERTRYASLVVRGVNAYRWRADRYLIGSAVLILVTGTVLTIATAEHSTGAVTAIAAAVACCSLGFTMVAGRLSVRIVEQARDHSVPVSETVDDALRSTAVRAIAHSTLGVLACAIGIVALLAIQSQTYEAVKINDRAIFTVPDGGRLWEVSSTSDPSVVGAQPTKVAIRWNDADGTGHTAVRTRPAGQYLGSGTYVDSLVVTGIAGLVSLLALVVAISEWSRAAKTWRRPGPFPRISRPTAMQGAGGTA